MAIGVSSSAKTVITLLKGHVLEVLAAVYHQRVPSRLLAVTFDAHDPDRLAGFWAGVLGRGVVDDPRVR